jgi:hypothetical protein
MKNKLARSSMLLVLVAGMGWLGCISPILSHAEGEKSSPESAESKNVSEVDCDVHFKKSGFCAAMDWVKHQTDEETGEFVLRFWKAGEGRASGPYVSPPSSIFVRLWMPSMNHGSSPVKVFPHLDLDGSVVSGVYDVKQVYFSMGGDWEIQIQIQIKNGSEIIDNANIKVQY